MIKTYSNRYKCTDSGTVCNKKDFEPKGSEIFEIQGNSK